MRLIMELALIKDCNLILYVNMYLFMCSQVHMCVVSSGTGERTNLGTVPQSSGTLYKLLLF